MDLRGNNDCTLCQRARKQREDNQREGCGRTDHIQSARCALQANRLRQHTTVTDSKFRKDLSDTCGGAIDSNYLEGDVSGTLPTDNSHRSPITGNDGCSARGHNGR